MFRRFIRKYETSNLLSTCIYTICIINYYILDDEHTSLELQVTWMGLTSISFDTALPESETDLGLLQHPGWNSL